MGKVIDMTLREFAEAFDFGLLVGYEDSGEKFYQLEDFQGANLGGIESEKFLDAAHIADRLDTYYYDYIVSDLQEEFGYKGDFNDYEEMLKFALGNDEISDYETSLIYYITHGNELKTEE